MHQQIWYKIKLVSSPRLFYYFILRDVVSARIEEALIGSLHLLFVVGGQNTRPSFTKYRNVEARITRASTSEP
jgi:hypothetical protein